MSHSQILDPNFPDCPIRNILVRVAGKWPILVLLVLGSAENNNTKSAHDNAHHKGLRFGDIRKAIPDISQRMLTTILRDLEADGLVSRKAFSEIPPRVEYALTDRARTLLPIIQQLVGWAIENKPAIITDRTIYIQSHRE